MKPLSAKPLATLVLSIALSTSVTAFADSQEIGDDLYCNSITQECKSLEQFQVKDFKGLNGYKSYNDKMELIRKELPDLAKKIDKAMDDKTWYVIPSNFTTSHPIDHDSSEGIISASSLDKLTEGPAAVKLMEQALNTAQPSRDPSPARVLAEKILAKNSNALTIQEATVKNQFGIFFTPKQLKEQHEYLQLRYMSHLSTILTNARNECDTYKKNPGLRAKDKLDAISSFLDDEAEKNMPIGTWNSPFSHSPSIGQGMTDLNSRATSQEVPEVEFAARYSAEGRKTDYSPDFSKIVSKKMGNYGAIYQADLDTIADNYTKLNDQLERDSFQIRENVAQSHAFKDLLAIQVKLKGDVTELQGGYNADENQKRLEPIFRDVADLAHTVPRNQPQEVTARLCSDVTKVSADVDHLTMVLTEKYQPKQASPRQNDLFDEDEQPKQPRQKKDTDKADFLPAT